MERRATIPLDLPPPPQRDAGGRPSDVYAATQAGMLSDAARGLPNVVYVPGGVGTVDVVDAMTYRVIGHIPTGRRALEVVPSWDLTTLWVVSADGLLPIDPRTGRRGAVVPVTAPYDLYFTMNGRAALVMTRPLERIEVRNPHTMRLRSLISVPCRGLNRADFSADGASLIAGCAWSGQIVRVDVTRQKVTGVLSLSEGSSPQDIRLSPDGSLFYVADMTRGGVWLIDAAQFQKVGFIGTGTGAHGLYPSRDSSTLYVADHDSVALVSFASRRLIGRWRVPGSSGTGGVSADGTVVWLSGREGDLVYAVSTANGQVIRRIPVGRRPDNPCVYPQPGRFSLGHTGIYR